MNLIDNTLLQGGKYRIIRFISSGGFGCTYEAELVLLHKRVAIKEFFVKDFCNRDENNSYVTVATQSKVKLVERLKKKFIEEASALFSMQHLNIVRVTDVFEENGTAYYVMDYIDGKSLQDIVKEKGALDEDLAVNYITQIADALKYVHSLNRLHLDIKPGNIMINENNQAILIDFGASKQYDEVDGENTSTLLGKTPGYAPLEQIGNEVARFLPATDIYALGATFYKLVTGVTPISAALLASGETLEFFPATVSTFTQKAISEAMRINKNKRPQSIDAFLSLLDADKSKEVVPKMKKEEEKPVADDFSEETIIDSHSDMERIFADAKEYQNKKDYKKAFELYLEAAKQGYMKAQHNLGCMYQYGHGVSQDYSKAVEWLTKAAEQGDAAAQCNLGYMYQYGYGVSQDYSKAVELYTKAAEQGDAAAQCNLGNMYQYGYGVSQDYSKAVEWLTKAAEQGNATAQCNLGYMYQYGYGVSQDYSKAVEWLTKAAEQGNATAQCNLGIMYQYGYGVSQDYSKAVEWYTKAAEQGNESAERELKRLKTPWYKRWFSC